MHNALIQIYQEESKQRFLGHQDKLFEDLYTIGIKTSVSCIFTTRYN